MGQLYHVFDTETASLHGGVVELAYISIDGDLNIVEEFRSLCNPGRPIEPRASDIHGYKDEDVSFAPTAGEVLARFAEPVLFIAHNAPFDARMLKDDLAIKAKLCTLSLSRQYIKGTDNHKLETLQGALGFSKQVSHSALGDCRTVVELLRHILPIAGVTLETLFERALVPKLLAKMPFGKYAGKSMLKVPKDYREWLLQQPELEKDLKFTLEHYRNL